MTQINFRALWAIVFGAAFVAGLTGLILWEPSFPMMPLPPSYDQMTWPAIPPQRYLPIDDPVEWKKLFTNYGAACAEAARPSQSAIDEAAAQAIVWRTEREKQLQRRPFLLLAGLIGVGILAALGSWNPKKSAR